MDFTTASGVSNSEGCLHSNNGGWGATWAIARDSTDSNPSVSNPVTSENSVIYTPDTWAVRRYFFEIFYNGLPATAIISGADVHYYGTSYEADSGYDRGYLYLGTQGDTLVNTNWNAQSTLYGNDTVDIGGWGWQTLSLNAAGYGAISSGSTIKYCIRGKTDVDDREPGNVYSGLTLRTAAYANFEPFVRVTYTLPSGGGNPMMFSSGGGVTVG